MWITRSLARIEPADQTDGSAFNRETRSMHAREIAKIREPKICEFTPAELEAVSAGVINTHALSLPKPAYPPIK